MPQEKKLKLSAGIRRYIRGQKSQIRRQVFDKKEQEKLISELYQKILNK